VGFRTAALRHGVGIQHSEKRIAPDCPPDNIKRQIWHMEHKIQPLCAITQKKADSENGYKTKQAP
jgi:hypothetical protein